MNVLKGQVWCYRVFDIAEGVDLDVARRLLAQDSRRLKFDREGSEFIQLPNPPLQVELGIRRLELKAGAVEADLAVRLFDHGAMSVLLRVPIARGTSLTELIPLADELYDSASVDEVARATLESLRATLAPAVEAAHLWNQHEGYGVVFVESFESPVSASQVLADPALPRLLLGETKETRLSAQESADVLQQHFSYSENDLVVVDWNAAFVYEPSGSRDVPDLIEIANAQLLELRYYDDVLDRQLKRVYDAMGERRADTMLASPYKKLSRELMLTLIELSEFIERVENSLKIVGDFYLARVYESAVRQLRVDSWKVQVARKLKLLSQTYALLRGEVDTRRSLTLEMMIVVLILVEMVIAMLQLVPHK